MENKKAVDKMDEGEFQKQINTPLRP